MDAPIENIDDYIAQFPDEIGARLEKIRAIVRNAAPDAVEKISYGMPAFSLKKKNLVYFAAFKNHIGVYALPTVNVAFKPELEKYKTGKGSIQFPLDEELPVELIQKLVIFRINELL